MGVIRTIGLWIGLVLCGIGLLLSVAWNASEYGGWFEGIVVTCLILITWEVFRWSVRRDDAS